MVPIHASHYLTIAPFVTAAMDALLAILTQPEIQIDYARLVLIVLLKLKTITVAPKTTIVLNARQKALNVMYVQLDTSFIKRVPLQQLVFVCFYLACDNSCIQCSPGPTCYNCAEIITQTGSTCRVDPVGFQISADLPNIILDFAYPLSTGLTKSSITATSKSNAQIPTAGWTITGCTAGLKQCSITTDDLHESDIPISLDFQFTQT